MTGPILAVILLLQALFIGALVLSAFQIRRDVRKPSRTSVRPIEDAVTQEQLELFKKDIDQRTEWVLNEWYEKFSTLHARLSKRASRAASAPPPPGEPVNDQPSVLQFRRMGSP